MDLGGERFLRSLIGELYAQEGARIRERRAVNLDRIALDHAALFGKTGALKVERGPKETRKTLFAKGFVVEFANPKALLYFAAILPQFLDPSAPIAPQIAIMGLTTLVMDVVVYSAYAFLGQTITQSGVRPWIVKLLNRSAGSALLFAAFKMVRVSN